MITIVITTGAMRHCGSRFCSRRRRGRIDRLARIGVAPAVQRRSSVVQAHHPQQAPSAVAFAGGFRPRAGTCTSSGRSSGGCRPTVSTGANACVGIHCHASCCWAA